MGVGYRWGLVEWGCSRVGWSIVGVEYSGGGA